jgi:hypothetical protein
VADDVGGGVDEQPGQAEQGAVEDLYRLPPDEFVAARDAAARELRSAGDRAAADRVRALRKPTVAAWALNQAVRAVPGPADELVAVAQDVREAQERALTGGDATALREAARRKRDAIQALTAAASRVLTTAGRDARAQAVAISSTLEAAASDPTVAAVLRAGCIAGDPVPEDTAFGFGFGATDEVDLTQPARPGVTRTRRSPRITGPSKVATKGPASTQAARRKVVGAAQWEHEKAVQAAEKTEAAVVAARAQLATAQAEVEQARKRLRTAEGAAAAAEVKVAKAREKHDANAAKAATAARVLEKARRALDE